MVHGDDFTFSGERGELEYMKEKMKGWYDIKDRGIMGSGEDEIKEVCILGRSVRWNKWGIEYEADQGHRNKLMKVEGLDENSNSVAGPTARMDEEMKRWDEEDLDE